MIPSLRALRRLTISTCLVLAVAALARAGEGDAGIAGRVLDAASGQVVEGVKIEIVGPGPTRETRVSGADGAWEVTPVPAGTYTLRFEKAGYKAAVINRFVVRPSEPARADLSLSALPPDEPELPSDVEEFVVVGTKAEAIEASRESSDQLLNTLSAEEFSKFAASDVADALKFVPGVNVVKGQFAIIRGLEDRYSSTLYNGAPVPSPDPDRQSIPLDLFPSEVVTNLVVAKTFAPELPSNSSGGSINIITHDYPEGLEVKLSAAVGVNSNANDSFWHLDGGSSYGRESTGYGNVLGNEFGLSIAGRSAPQEREIRYKLVLNRDVESNTAVGFQEGREPVFGGLAKGELQLTDGRFDLTDSDEETQVLGYGGFGIDLDAQGNHKIDVSAFYTQKEVKAIELKENGYLPNYDYSRLTDGHEINPNADFAGFATPSSWISRTVRTDQFDPPSRGPLFFSNFTNSTAFDRKRDLLVTQLNADHTFESVEGLHASWGANYAQTTQDETARGTRIFFEPTDVATFPDHVPPTLEQLGPGRFAAPKAGILFSGANVDEHQYFARVDVDYTRDLVDAVTLKFNAGGWFEQAERQVSAFFLQDAAINTGTCPSSICVGSSSQFAIMGDTQNEVGHQSFLQLLREPDGDFRSLRDSTNDSTRDITAGDFGMKATVWDQVDLLGGLRVERLQINSNNQAFVPGQVRFGAPATFPEAYLFFDRLDNPARGEVLAALPPGTVFNDQILGIDVPVDPTTGFVDLTTRQAIESLVNGKIDETKLLPSAGLAYRPIEGLALRGAFSQTVARPSFREIGFYVSVEPGSDDLIVGNPQLKLSDVESYDVRGEYTWGDFGDLAAVSGFYKRIDDPIESIVIRNPINQEASTSALYRTFFNNPNVARLWGIETELRKNLGFLGLDSLHYFSLGGNFTYIDAKVGRTEAELARSTAFFSHDPNAHFKGLKPTRRLFGQPKWIANADLTFDQPDWGTRATVAFFAISDVLDAAGVASLDQQGIPYTLTLDRYVDSFSRLDVIVSQTVHVDSLGSDLVFKISGKNLTDTPRRLIYDPSQTAQRIAEREYRVGRDFKFTVTWAF
jgi:TonB-dependent receptor